MYKCVDCSEKIKDHTIIQDNDDFYHVKCHEKKFNYKSDRLEVVLDDLDLNMDLSIENMKEGGLINFKNEFIYKYWIEGSIIDACVNIIKMDKDKKVDK